jgi:hypothetical protein
MASASGDRSSSTCSSITPSACNPRCWPTRSAASGRWRPAAWPRFNTWAEALKDHPEATKPLLDAFCRNLYAPGFVYCADRDFVKTVRTPCMVFAGNDDAHPYPISKELSKLIPNCEFIAEWKTGAALTLAKSRVAAFSAKHTPSRA